MDETLTLQFDGGSRGNPGPAGIGVVVAAADGTPLVTLGRFIGRATNNVAEYRALLLGLARARALGATEIEVINDSELVAKQLTGVYKVKHADMRVLHAEAREALAGFQSWAIRSVPRAQNARADALVNAALDGAAPAAGRRS